MLDGFEVEGCKVVDGVVAGTEGGVRVVIRRRKKILSSRSIDLEVPWRRFQLKERCSRTLRSCAATNLSDLACLVALGALFSIRRFSSRTVFIWSSLSSDL